MAIVRVHHSSDFTVISNNIFRNKELSLKARGLLCSMLSMPDEWDFNVAGLAATTPDGVTAVRTAIQELESHGYIVRQRMCGKDGRFIGWAYHIYETPTLENPKSELPKSEKPISETPPQLNTNKLNTKRIKDLKNKKSISKDIDSIVEIYHQHCPSLPKVRGVTDSRKRAIQRILAKHKKQVLIEVFDKAEQSDFLTGDNDRGWRANLDFILREDKFIGILEGKYDNKKGKQRKLQMNNLTKEQKERSRQQYEAGKVRTI